MTAFERIGATVAGIGVLAGLWLAMPAPGAAALPQAERTASAAGPRPESVTYIGNSGFLIRAGGKKILIDALFDGERPGYVLPGVVKQAVTSGKAPFDGIDLVLATHVHADHFAPAPVRRCLANNPRAVFAGPPETTDTLAKLGARAITLNVPDGRRERFEINGITVDAMPLSHGIPPPGVMAPVNLGYLIAVGGFKFFHTGDVDPRVGGVEAYRSLGLPAEHVDVAFIQHFYLGTPPGPHPFVTEGIGARFVVVSHLENTDSGPNYAQIQRAVPNAIVLRKELDTWPIPPR
jgi:L-ascorbate metabolism protein UlaG (beta-lactamase superfamily)